MLPDARCTTFLKDEGLKVPNNYRLIGKCASTKRRIPTKNQDAHNDTQDATVADRFVREVFGIAS